ncbi:MAG: glycosyl hydrolase family 79 C-terminal domain-containing protein [Actinomycetota bacterium]|nr:glycosyl hydrolase family 79 C-terminal domain-containing protein [Actinomycetota bacterium]
MPTRALCDDAGVLYHGRQGRKVAAGAVRLGLALAALLAACTLAAPAGADIPVLGAQVGAASRGRAMTSGFVGFSFEYRALHVYTGRDPSDLNPVLVALLRDLAPAGGQVLRIGGDSTDQTWWPMHGVIPPGGVSYSLTKGWLRTTRTLAQTLRAKLILGVNLAARRPALSAAEGQALLAGIGSSNIAALEIGNEPDLYPVFAWFKDRRDRVSRSRSRHYAFAGFLSEFARLRATLPRGLALAGPTFSGLNWMRNLPRFLAAQHGVRIVTFHRYPLRACVHDPSDPSFASIENLLADSSSAGLAAEVVPFVQAAHARGLPFRLDELNSASCRGRAGVSDTFAASLWLLDTLFNEAAVGVDGVNIHTLPGAPYEPFTFSHDAGGWHALVHPSFYGALMFTRAFPPGARLLPVAAPAGPVKVWATRGADGHTRVVVINQQPDTPVVVKLQLPGAQAPLTAQELTAPGLGATGGVTLDGQSFGTRTDSGVPQGRPSGAVVAPTAGTYPVQVAPGSAVLLTR